MTYQGIVYISNEIRQVLNTSREVKLSAQNASLAARRAGRVLGFQTVSAELMIFGEGLGNAMSEMAGNILSVAEGVSGISSHKRSHKYLQVAHTINGKSELLTETLKRVEHREAGLGDVLSERLRRLEKRLFRALRLCNNGRALVSSAKIEASSGGEWEESDEHANSGRGRSSLRD